ncbi:astacin-like metalloprotease toxin 5 [Uloborus diversus]|uniref:astacin-like metalloprotease toxin 5 n=1 Tax=Uloborus diversus TaxID=327109 RepID=UPI0024099D6A|nr:astacin-like metalloprotease toxin 5 [Uloborus diversus]
MYDSNFCRSSQFFFFSFFLSEKLGSLIMENPDLFGGDILGMEDFEDRNAIADRTRIWPDGIVPFEEDPGLKDTVHPTVLKSAMTMYQKDTCIKFVPRTTEKDYIRIFPGQGCYSHVGKTGDGQPLSLGKGCGLMGIVFHQLTHALGFYHEHNRSDRDDYLVIFWENIQEGMEDHFVKLSEDQNRLLTVFDYNSIMLYGSYKFSKDSKNLKTMVGTNNKVLQEIHFKYFLSDSDKHRVNMMYKCP